MNILTHVTTTYGDDVKTITLTLIETDRGNWAHDGYRSYLGQAVQISDAYAYTHSDLPDFEEPFDMEYVE